MLDDFIMKVFLSRMQVTRKEKWQRAPFIPIGERARGKQARALSLSPSTHRQAAEPWRGMYTFSQPYASARISQL